MDTAALTSDLPELMDIILVQKAAGIAALAHDGQTDKAGRPYVEHVHRVAAAVDTGLERAVALLHDVVEDTEGDAPRGRLRCPGAHPRPARAAHRLLRPRPCCRLAGGEGEAG